MSAANLIAIVSMLAIELFCCLVLLHQFVLLFSK